MTITLQEDDHVPGTDAHGRAIPSYARDIGLRPAPVIRRCAAFTLDLVIYLVLAIPAAIGWTIAVRDVWWRDQIDLGRILLPVILIAAGHFATSVFGLVQLILHGKRSLTVGKLAFGLRSVAVTHFGAPGFWRVVLRCLILWGSQVVLPVFGPVLMFVSQWFDPENRRRSWLDRAARCWLIDIRKGLDPRDKKAMRHARRRLEQTERPQEAPLPSLASRDQNGSVAYVPKGRSTSAVISHGGGTQSEPGLSHPGEWQESGTDDRSHATPDDGTAPQISPPPVDTKQQPRDVPHGQVVLRFDDGSVIPAAGIVRLGRDPSAPAEQQGPGGLIPLQDPQMQMSKTHAELRADPVGDVTVRDLGSTNGSWVRNGDSPWSPLPVGTPEKLAIGAAVRIGSREFEIVWEDAG